MRSLPLEDLDVPDARTADRFLWWLARGLGAPIGLGILYGIVAMVARSFIPLITGIIIDRGIIGHSQEALLSWGAVMLALALVQAAASTLQMRCDFATSMGAAFTAMRLVGRQAAYLGATLRDRISAGETMNIGVGDITPIGAALSSTSRGAGAAVAVIVVAVVMLSTAWQVGLVVLIGVPASIWLLNRARGPVRRRQRELRAQQGALTSIAIDIGSGLRILRGIGGEDPFAASYRAESQRTRQLGVASAGATGASGVVRVILTGLISASVVWIAAELVLDKQLRVGQLVAFYGYAAFLATPLTWLTNTADFLAQGRISAERVIRYLSLERAIPDDAAVPEIARDAELADPRSGLTIPSGSFTAVACASPSDAAVLSDRLGSYGESEATIGGMPVAGLPLSVLREHVLVVRNDDYLFAGALRTELDTRHSASADDILAMASTASALDIIEALPDGLDSAMQAGGRNFSGGERQRLRLLRALLADPEILVLVEPSSGLDAITEAQVVRRTRERRQGKTTVVFSTSPVVLGQADQVRYVEESKVVASGSHTGLLADKRYEALVARGAV
jgi:ABC-type multidrug transport system fused ATPase/permease subunit